MVTDSQVYIYKEKVKILAVKILLNVKYNFNLLFKKFMNMKIMYCFHSFIYKKKNMKHEFILTSGIMSLNINHI